MTTVRCPRCRMHVHVDLLDSHVTDRCAALPPVASASTGRAGPRPKRRGARSGPLFPVDALVRAARCSNRLQLDRLLGRNHWANSMHARGGLTVRQADEAAIALDLHPVLVWGDDWLTDDTPERRTA